MGGYGSGRRQRGRETTSDMRALDVRRLQREGLLTPGRCFMWKWTRDDQEIASIQIRTEAGRVILNYRIRSDGGEWQPMKYPVCVEWTRCHLGGQRAWFRCPVKGCGRRVAILYGGSIFGCRHCHKLVYESQRENDEDRATRRAETIRGRLGWEPGILNGGGRKPKGMHWRTYERLRAEHDAIANVALGNMAERLGLVNRL